jgi:dipeptidyl aminopeptidase/acylaminoacyl peptidase
VTTAATAEATLDPDGYAAVLPGLSPRSIGLNETVSFSDVAVGDHSVTLHGLQINCTTPNNPANVTVVGGANAQVTFDVTCWPPTTGRIAFSDARRGWYEIYSVDSDGRTDLRRVSTVDDVGATDLWPSWSPDGWKIAFTRIQGKDEYDIYVVNADGTGQAQLTHGVGRDAYPSWSPDGSKIAFSSDGDEPGILDIWVMNADGTGQTRLTEEGHNEQPSWSPDGSKIVFGSIRDGVYEVYMMNADGTDQVNLTRSLNTDDWPSGQACSPDGSQIVFVSARDGNWEIYLMNADGTDQRRLTDSEYADEPHAWSPDGTRILFTRNGLILSMNLDGTGIQQAVVPSPEGDQLWPAWSHGTGALDISAEKMR